MRGVWAARGLAGLDLPAACPPCGSIPLRTDFSVLRGLPPREAGAIFPDLRFWRERICTGGIRERFAGNKDRKTGKSVQAN